MFRHVTMIRMMLRSWIGTGKPSAKGSGMQARVWTAMFLPAVREREELIACLAIRMRLRIPLSAPALDTPAAEKPGTRWKKSG
jgi:hypothetical protein